MSLLKKTVDGKRLLHFIFLYVMKHIVVEG